VDCSMLDSNPDILYIDIKALDRGAEVRGTRRRNGCTGTRQTCGVEQKQSAVERETCAASEELLRRRRMRRKSPGTQ